MAGSLRWFSYVADNGASYAVFRDESNTEVVNRPSEHSGVSIPTNPLPNNIIPRSVRIKQPSGFAARDIIVLSPSRFAEINGTSAFLIGDGDIDSGVTFTVTSKNGEKVTRIPVTADTGKNDGDNP